MKRCYYLLCCCYCVLYYFIILFCATFVVNKDEYIHVAGVRHDVNTSRKRRRRDADMRSVAAAAHSCKIDFMHALTDVGRLQIDKCILVFHIGHSRVFSSCILRPVFSSVTFRPSRIFHSRVFSRPSL